MPDARSRARPPMTPGIPCGRLPRRAAFATTRVQSTNDPEAMLHRKVQGKEAKLAYLDHGLLDSRSWARHQTSVRPSCTGTVELDVGGTVAAGQRSNGQHGRSRHRATMKRASSPMSASGIVTHLVAQKVRWSAIDGLTSRHAGYHVSQRKRKLAEQVCGCTKTVGDLRKLRHRGVPTRRLASSPSPPWRYDTWSACGIWRRRVPDRRPRVSPDPSSGSSALPVRTVVGRACTGMMLRKTARYPGSSSAC